jgi:hypothetical protein
MRVKSNSLLAVLVGLTLNLGLSGSAHAELQGRNMDANALTFEAYYDTDLDITWLADANYGAGSVYDNGSSTTDGRMDWWDATDWVADLSFTNPLTNQTYDNWRLPTVNPVNGSNFNYDARYDGSSDVGFNVSEQGTAFAGSTSSEMAHLYYNTLNNKAFCAVVTLCFGPQPGWGLLNTSPFINLQAGVYWSATEHAPNTNGAWLFLFNDGTQGARGKVDEFYALAVSPGDIAAVPETDTWTMLLAGLGLVGAAVSRRRADSFR